MFEQLCIFFQDERVRKVSKILAFVVAIALYAFSTCTAIAGIGGLNCSNYKGAEINNRVLPVAFMLFVRVFEFILLLFLQTGYFYMFITYVSLRTRIKLFLECLCFILSLSWLSVYSSISFFFCKNVVIFAYLPEIVAICLFSFLFFTNFRGRQYNHYIEGG